MEYDNVIDEPTDDDADVTLPERKHSPYRKKQLDYKHQIRILSSGNRGYRKALKLLPHLERRSYRKALNAATHAAERDEEAELTSADELRQVKRSKFSHLNDRPALPLRQALQIKQEKRKARDGKNKKE